METTFPDGLIHHINENYGEQGIQAEFLMLDAVRMDQDAGYEVILDRISHEVPFYRSFLKLAALKGAYVVNNPFWWSADDKFIDNVIAEAAGVAVPRSIILPHKDHMPNTGKMSYRNMKYPINWDAAFDYIGFPAFIKPHDGGGWRGVSRVTDPDEFFKAYDASGRDCMMLQEDIEFEDYYRCYGVGQKEVRIMRYNPAADTAQSRYTEVDDAPAAPALLERMENDVLSLCTGLGYDFNTIEFAVRDGIPYAIDFMNPAPDADYHTVGRENYEWVVSTVGAFLVKKAKQARRKRQFSANGVLEPGA
jgi:hypothetical protein